ncbi:MAG: bifunctional folylpolyglutamate synthase/dihydrofolate synthase [Bacteroidia bacterium]|nr:bifunctional folylpolyglutamate synthase/dihydrofolate synthase [Bacteroidia bacterium]
MNYQSILKYLYNRLPMFQRIGSAAYKTDLINTIRLCEVTGNPYQQLKTIHIAGTNGKGSISHAISAIFQKSGFKTGLYTSPHLVDFRERIKINGKFISKKYVRDFVNEYYKEIEEINPSFFEVTVAMAFKYFKEKKVDIAIIETGLGGRLDSTNIITPLLSVISNISFDHTALLGNTLQEIAFEKAGIIKENVPVVIGETQESIKEIFINKALECNSSIFFADKNLSLYNKKIESDLKGDYQQRNMLTVLQCVEVLNERNFKLEKSIVNNALKNIKKLTGLRGRWDILSEKPMVICDTAHNEAGLKVVFNQIGNINFKKLHIVFGVVNDKDTKMYWDFLPSNAYYYFCKPDIPRGREAKSIANEAMEKGIKGLIFNSVLEAVIYAKSIANANDLIFIGGSTFTVADYYTAIENNK